MMNEEKQKALEAALGHIEKQYGKGSVMKLGDSSSNMVVEAVPTGSLGLDIALGVGGVPKGRIVEIYGPESSGKTTVALHMVAEVQKRGGIAGFIDAEHALDPVYAKNIGVDIDNLYISQPDNGEQALEITETMVRSGAVDIVIVDSVAALVPKAEIPKKNMLNWKNASLTCAASWLTNIKSWKSGPLFRPLSASANRVRLSFPAGRGGSG